MRSVLLLAVASALGANAHYHIQTFNGGTTGLRQHYRQSGEIDSPITGNDINSDAIVCGFNKPLSTPATAVNVNAGSTATVTYSPNVFHPGPFQVYASRSTTPPFSWAKVYENWTFKSGTTQFQDQLGSSFSFPIPAGMASGRWLLRVEHNAMHQASQVGGAQFYVRCIDINVVNGGSVSSPSPAISLPGGYTSSTTGVVWPI
ncbi:hypothetical protein HK097_001034 [Rhizophlyctis rosea]|uniref:lytic cellulose monooxygenase (C4-dehydrogenating) n=1 Tax=Rhizophlyctis rosea TaxID=64517 RepID=A0AAD5SKF6_9FUNG|nr:hypothetical protein HK097_001034 [Rhizophlyctis rosea]